MNIDVISSCVNNELGIIMPSLQTDIVGRVKRLPLDPTEESTLLPMFEAISNGLHAIEDRFGNNSLRNGVIAVTILRDDGDENRPIIGYIIQDNGVGLNQTNFDSFCKPDSVYKIKRGGKGVGRLGWLKVFKNIDVYSRFQDQSGQIETRAFLFKLTNENQIEEKINSAHALTEVGTIITLKDFTQDFHNQVPTSVDVIKQRIIAHFLPLFASESVPKISLIDDGQKIDLQDFFDGFKTNTSEEEVSFFLNDEEIHLQIRHIKLNKKIRLGLSLKNYNWLYMAANSRVANEKKLDNYLGLKVLEGEQVYIGCAYGDFLDQRVNQERTGFNCKAEVIEEIVRSLSSAIKNYLSDDIQAIKQQKKKTINSLIDEHPQFLYIKGDTESFVDHLAPSAIQKKDIFAAMCADRYEKTSKFKRVKENIALTPSFTNEIKKQVEECNRFITESGQGMLAEYVLTRKVTIEFLNKYLELNDVEQYEKEDAVHKLIVPMRTDSNRLTIEDHNLWLLDDRLAFFSFFASDQPIRQYIDSDSEKRPDVAFFYDSCMAWNETENGNKVVLVEFKRPSRDDYSVYSKDKNPIQQLIDYIQLFKEGGLKDYKGRTPSQNLKNASFHCYLVADLTPSLLSCLQGRKFTDTPDGKGKIGYFSEPDGFVEIIPYDKLVNDAQMRNAIFLQKLGINKTN